MGRGGPWTDRDVLYEEYVVKGKTRKELADQWDCAEGTIQYWQDKHGIEKRDRGGADKDAEYRDKETLVSLYHGEGLSLSEIADELDCSVFAVQRWMDKHGVETDLAPQDPKHPPYHGFSRNPNGGVGQVYEVGGTRIDGVNFHISVHRLIAVAIGLIEPSEMWDNDIHIHHKSGHGLDNRHSNLERLDIGDHTREHEPWVNSPVIGQN